MVEISLGQRLHQLRDKAALSLRELAKKVGVFSHSEEELALRGKRDSES
jgi:transcriptional regulator with XRE-family HTH domain